MPFAPSSFLLLVVRPGAPSSVLAPRSFKERHAGGPHQVGKNADVNNTPRRHPRGSVRVGADPLHPLDRCWDTPCRGLWLAERYWEIALFGKLKQQWWISTLSNPISEHHEHASAATFSNEQRHMTHMIHMTLMVQKRCEKAVDGNPKDPFVKRPLMEIGRCSSKVEFF